MAHFVTQYFPGFPVRSRPRIERVLTRGTVLQGWVILGVLVYVDVLGEWALKSVPGAQLDQNPWRLLTVVFPMYVLLLAPALRFSLAVAGLADGGAALSTSVRTARIRQERQALGLLLLAAVLFWPNLFQATLTVPQLKELAFSGAQSDLQTTGLIALLTILLHYLIVVELPFWWGQRAWKQTELQRTRNQVRAAESILETRAANIDVSPNSSQSMGGFIISAWANYTLAQERLHAAERIPEHTVSDAVDLATKLGLALVSSILAAVVLRLLSLR